MEVSMGLCKDPVTTELNKRGYNLVKLPRVGIDPMDVLGRENDSMATRHHGHGGHGGGLRGGGAAGHWSRRLIQG